MQYLIIDELSIMVATKGISKDWRVEVGYQAALYGNAAILSGNTYIYYKAQELEGVKPNNYYNNISKGIYQNLQRLNDDNCSCLIVRYTKNWIELDWTGKKILYLLTKFKIVKRVNLWIWKGGKNMTLKCSQNIFGLR